MKRASSKMALPRGFRFAATACGLRKKNRVDLGLITSDAPAAAAAVFTTNLVQAAPVVLCRAHLRESAGAMRAIIVNSGNANCATGPAGMAAARATTAAVARELGCRAEQILVCSTGVIGVPLRVERILNAVPTLARAQVAAPAAFHDFTRAIMTTDTRPKWAVATCRIGGKRVRLLGCAKGAGMIHPQMAPPTATMLAFVLTDAACAPRVLQRALGDVVGRTFNAITIDGDTSTNDTLLLLASGASGAPLLQQVPHLQRVWHGRYALQPVCLGARMRQALAPEVGDYSRFVAALEKVCHALALEIVADGEGASRVVEVEVRGAPSEQAAEQVARTIAGSPLVKTALAGADPNWGRILAAAGRAGVAFDPTRVEISLAGIKVYSRGRPLPFDERMAHRKLLSNYITIGIDLGAGKQRSRVTNHKSRSSGTARIWTCDFTADYVNINASYRS